MVQGSTQRDPLTPIHALCVIRVSAPILDLNLCANTRAHMCVCMCVSMRECVRLYVAVSVFASCCRCVRLRSAKDVRYIAVGTELAHSVRNGAFLLFCAILHDPKNHTAHESAMRHSCVHMSMCLCVHMLFVHAVLCSLISSAVADVASIVTTTVTTSDRHNVTVAHGIRNDTTLPIPPAKR